MSSTLVSFCFLKQPLFTFSGDTNFFKRHHKQPKCSPIQHHPDSGSARQPDPAPHHDSAANPAAADPSR